MDGLEAARQVLARRPTAIVMLTACSERALIEQAKGAAVFGYLVKPVKEDLPAPTFELAAARFQEWQTLNAVVATLQESLETRDLVDEAKRKLNNREG
jgi:response regulator NasT